MIVLLCFQNRWSIRARRYVILIILGYPSAEVQIADNTGQIINEIRPMIILSFIQINLFSFCKYCFSSSNSDKLCSICNSISVFASFFILFLTSLAKDFLSIYFLIFLMYWLSLWATCFSYEFILTNIFILMIFLSRFCLMMIKSCILFGLS